MPPNRRELFRDIRRSFGAVNTTLNSRSDLAKLYEAYVMGLILDWARTAGRTVEWVDYYGNPARIVKLPGGPRYFTSANYSHAVVTRGADVREIHAGVKVMGVSGVLHELDICGMSRSAAELCRANRCHPNHTLVSFGFEVKCYETALKIGLGREIIGLDREMTGTAIGLVSSGEIGEAAHAVIWQFCLLGALERIRPPFPMAPGFIRLGLLRLL